jgi:protein-L-isoaspartate(D-aspartate) O-methyltransferase
MNDLQARRRFFAEEVQMVANIRSASVVDALATVPRERFLPPGPWTVRSEADFAAPARQTDDANPRHVYHNVAIGIEPARMLFNGAPSVVAMAIDALAVAPGGRVLHIGAGTGYYTALLAHCTGPTGRVLAFEVDGPLAARAGSNLATMPWVDVKQGDGSAPLEESFDAILVNAGVTHPLDSWLDALTENGRMVMPLTAAMGPSNIGKGLMLLLTRTADREILTARLLTFVAIFSAVGVRNDALNGELAAALAKRPFGPIKRLRRDAHERTDACWMHGSAVCFASE